MAKFHFFTNLENLNIQQESQAYGPVKNYENSQYRTTSLFSTSYAQMAYAVCDGKIFAQEVNGKINLLLKPNQQNSSFGMPVKYYVYKGILKSQIVDPNNINITYSFTSS